eukprot:gene24927-30115_t
MTHKGAALFVTKQGLEIAKEMPVVGQFIAPLYLVLIKVLMACEEVQGYRKAIASLEERVLKVQEVVLEEPNGLALVVKRRPELCGQLQSSVQIVVDKYEEICKVLEPLKTKSTFFKLFLATAAKIKERLDILDAEIVAEMKNLSLSLQVASFTLQIQTFDIVTDLQAKITHQYGGQEGLLSNEAGMQEVARAMGMEVADVRASVLDYLSEMEDKLIAHGSRQANQVIAFNRAQFDAVKLYIQQMQVPSSSPATSGGAATLSGSELADVTLKHPLLVDEGYELGEGRFGRVLKGSYQGQDVAVKVIKLSVLRKLGPAAVQDMKTEILIHHRLSSVPGVVRLIGVHMQDVENPKAVLELAEGSLHDALYHSADHPVMRLVVKDVAWRLDAVPYQDQEQAKAWNFVQLTNAVVGGARPTLFSRVQSSQARELVQLSASSAECAGLVASLERLVLQAWSPQPEDRESVEHLHLQLNRLFENLSRDEALQLLVHLGCAANLRQRLGSHGDDVDGVVLCEYDDVEFLQELEQDRSKLRSARLKAVLKQLQQMQQEGVPQQVLVELREQIAQQSIVVGEDGTDAAGPSASADRDE